MLRLSQIWGCLQDAEVVIKKKQTKLVVGKLLSYLDAFWFCSFGVHSIAVAAHFGWHVSTVRFWNKVYWRCCSICWVSFRHISIFSICRPDLDEVRFLITATVLY